MTTPLRTLIAIVWLGIAIGPTNLSAADANFHDASAGGEAAKLLDWHRDLDAAIQEARRLHKPILARAGAKWCTWCRKLDAEIAKPEVQKQLQDWVLMYIDTDDDPDDARRLNIGPIPALR